MAARPLVGVERLPDPHLRFLLNQVLNMLQRIETRLETVEARPTSTSSTTSSAATPTTVQEFQQTAAPTNPPRGRTYLYVEDDGAGKSRLVVKFPTGDPQVLETEP